MRIKINRFYVAAGISKQAFHQYLDRRLAHWGECEQLLPVIREIRKEYPTLSARLMYLMVHPVHMGRDRFESFCFNEGFKIERKRALHITTNSTGVTRFQNLIQEIELKGVNHVWVSDITYYRIKERFYYLTFITDLYSRRILGYQVSENLLTENTTSSAFRQSVKERNGNIPEIFHSDGGGQYYAKEFLQITGEKVKNSMGECAYENPHAERINGLIKNDYLKHYSPQTLGDLIRQTKRAVVNYNHKKHSALGMSPIEFEALSTFEQQLTKEKKKQKKKSQHQINKFVNSLKKVNPVQA